MDDRFFEFSLGQAVGSCAGEVSAELVSAAVGDQAGHRHEAAIAGGEFFPFPGQAQRLWFLRCSAVAAVAKPADHGGVAVVEEEAGAGVQCRDLIHLLFGEGEVEDVKVLGHALGPD